MRNALEEQKRDTLSESSSSYRSILSDEVVSVRIDDSEDSEDDGDLGDDIRALQDDIYTECT